MFNNLNWWNVAVLLLLALFIFGDKLPQIISDGLRMLRNLRRMARNATSDLSRELGTDIQLEDLHPKTFIRKHVLSEEDQEALVRPLKSLSEDITAQARDLGEDFREVHDQVGEPAGKPVNGSSGRGSSGRGGSRGQRGVRGGSGASSRSSRTSGASHLATEPSTASAAADGSGDSGLPAPRRSYDDIS